MTNKEFAALLSEIAKQLWIANKIACVDLQYRASGTPMPRREAMEALTKIIEEL